MNALFRREARRLGNGATLVQWQLYTAEGLVIDACLANAPSVQDGEVFFITAQNVDCLDAVPVAPLAEIEHGRQLTLYRIARERCTVTSG